MYMHVCTCILILKCRKQFLDLTNLKKSISAKNMVQCISYNIHLATIFITYMYVHMCTLDSTVWKYMHMSYQLMYTINDTEWIRIYSQSTCKSMTHCTINLATNMYVNLTPKVNQHQHHSIIGILLLLHVLYMCIWLCSVLTCSKQAIKHLCYTCRLQSGCLYSSENNCYIMIWLNVRTSNN